MISANEAVTMNVTESDKLGEINLSYFVPLSMRLMPDAVYTHTQLTNSLSAVQPVALFLSFSMSYEL